MRDVAGAVAAAFRCGRTAGINFAIFDGRLRIVVACSGSDDDAATEDMRDSLGMLVMKNSRLSISASEIDVRLAALPIYLHHSQRIAFLAAVWIVGICRMFAGGASRCTRYRSCIVGLMGRSHRDVMGIGLIALGAIVFAEGVGKQHVELELVARSALTFGAAMLAGLLGVLALDDLNVTETALGVGVTMAIALGLEHEGGAASIATSGAVLLAAVFGSCVVVAGLRGPRRPQRWSRPAAAGFLVYGVCALVMLGAIALATSGERNVMLRPMLSRSEPEGTILSTFLMTGMLIGLAAAWWLVPRVHLLDIGIGASVILETVARLGGGGLQVPGLSFASPWLLLGVLVMFRARSGIAPLPKHPDPVVEVPQVRVEKPDR